MTASTENIETVLTPGGNNYIEVKDGSGITNISIPLVSLATGLSTSAIDLLTDLVLGYKFRIEAFSFVTTVVGAGADDDQSSQVFNLAIGSTALTGGELTVDLSATDTVGKVAEGTAITGENVGSETDAISIEMAEGGVAFASGAGYFSLRVKNLEG